MDTAARNVAAICCAYIAAIGAQIMSLAQLKKNLAMHIAVDSSGSQWLVLERIFGKEKGWLLASLANFQKRKYLFLLCDVLALISILIGLAWTLYPGRIFLQSFPVSIVLLLLAGKGLRFKAAAVPPMAGRERLDIFLKIHLGLLLLAMVFCVVQVGCALRQIFFLA
ncbi:hypothetical protein [Janthinobacterium sp. 13]|uniref:hypothetical protein n=1 Tax=Janthinobacterium sp. 13 TaxID=2035211 RepID=UPI00117A9021|nr:hypothetical protein [Janthinobacterium sp. 13]